MLWPKPRPYPTPRRLPWRNSVTLCLAAECCRGRSRRYVIGSDSKIETPTATGEAHNKLVRLERGDAPVLLAGTYNRALELAAVIDNQFLRDDDQEGTLNKLKNSVVEFKRILAEQYVGTHLGVTYEWFLEKGKVQLPEEVYRKMVIDIGQMNLECSAIVVTPWGEDVGLFRITEDGEVGQSGSGSGRPLLRRCTVVAQKPFRI